MIKIEHNVETGEVKEVEMTPKEVAEFEARQAEAEAKAQEQADAEAARLAAEEQAQLDAATKAAAKAAIYVKLGLTEEEVDALLS